MILCGCASQDRAVVDIHIRTTSQASVVTMLKEQERCWFFNIYSARVSWNIQLARGWRPTRAMNVLKAVKSLTPPRVTAAVLRTWFDGWTTKGRFGIRGPASRCIWGCKGDSGDYLKRHYCKCQVLEDFGRCKLLLPRNSSPEDHIQNFLLIGGRALDYPDIFAKRALLLYAAHWTHNKASQWGTYTPKKCNQAIMQGLAAGVRGHDAATKLVDSLWTRK